MYRGVYVYNVFFYLKSPNCCEQEAVIHQSCCFCPVTCGWRRRVAVKWCSLLNPGAPCPRVIFLREGGLLSPCNAERTKCLPRLSPRPHAWPAAGGHAGWSPGAVRGVLHRVLGHEASVAPVRGPQASQRRGRGRCCPVFASAARLSQRGGACNRKASCLEKSLFNGVFLLMTLC